MRAWVWHELTSCCGKQMKGPVLCFRRRVTESRQFAVSQLSIKHRFIRYRIYMWMYIKRLFRFYPVRSGSVRCRTSLMPNLRLECYIVQFNDAAVTRGSPQRHNNTEGRKSPRPPLPTRRDPIQSNWIRSFSGTNSQQGGATLGRKLLLRTALDHYF